jgi:hypothetical protein
MAGVVISMAHTCQVSARFNAPGWAVTDSAKSPSGLSFRAFIWGTLPA